MMTLGEAELVQRTVAQVFGDPVGVDDQSALRRSLERPHATDNGIPRYPTFFNKVSAILHGILEHKPFKASNRRTAFCIMAFLLREKGYELRFEQQELDGLFTGVELGFTTNHRTTAWIKGHTVRIADGKGR